RARGGGDPRHPVRRDHAGGTDPGRVHDRHRLQAGTPQAARDDGALGPLVETRPDREARRMDRKWWTLVAACTATFMLLLDITIVNVALPNIQKDLGSSFSDLQWVIDAYSLMLASLLLTAGSLGDILGRRIVFAGGLVLFTAAALTCALATGPLSL